MFFFRWAQFLICLSLFSSFESTAFAYNYPCKCLYHCNCMHVFKGTNDPIEDFSECYSSKGLDKPINAAWHEFMKGILKVVKVGPIHIFDEGSPIGIPRLVKYYPYDKRQFHSVLDFINILDEYRFLISSAKKNWIKVFIRTDQGTLEKDLRRLETRCQAAYEAIDETYFKVLTLYQQALQNCHHTSLKSLSSIYNLGLIHLMNGDYVQAMSSLDKYMQIVEENNMTYLLNSQFYQKMGESYLEVNMYHQAIEALTNSINQDPENKTAYFHRATAYFETGNFDSAIDDYLHSDKSETILEPTFQVSQDFTDALLFAALEGSAEAIVEFVPNSLGSAYGITQIQWLHAPQPVNHILFAVECYKMGEFLHEYYKNFDWKQVENHVEEVKTLCNQYMDLTDCEKARLIGHVIGKYGTDIFAGAALIKGATLYNNLKNANRICTLESMALSTANKETIVASAVEHSCKRTEYFKNVKYNYDSHNKHVVGHNDFNPKGSSWKHPDPEGLLKKFAGNGSPRRGTPGSYGYKETVDFGEYIGIWRNEAGTISLPTTRGTIHYGKKGAHIVPSNPNPKVTKD